MTRRVVVHRNLLFVPNEAYIAAQVTSLRRYEALVTGLRIDRRAVAVPDVRRAVLQELVSPVRARTLELAMKFARIAPAPLVSRMRAFDPDLMHVHFGGDAYWSLPLARAAAVPLVVTFHGYDVNQRASSSAAAFAYTRLRPRVFRAASKIIAVSDFLQRRLLEEGCPPEKIVRHYIGVDTSFFARAGGPGPRPSVAFVARLVDFKGCDLLIEAASRLSIDLKLIIAGTGPEEDRLRALASRRGVDAEFAGAVSPAAVRQLLERAHVFCLPTYPSKEGHVESLSLGVLEAQSMGIPVVATRVGGVPEAVIDGETGLLVPPRDAGALTEALRSLLTDETRRVRMGAAARAHVTARFDLRAQTAALESIYDSVARGG